VAQKAKVLQLFEVIVHMQYEDGQVGESEYKTYAYSADEIWQQIVQRAERVNGFIINQHIKPIEEDEAYFAHTKQGSEFDDEFEEAPPWEPELDIEHDSVFVDTAVFDEYERSTRKAMALTFLIEEEKES
jgi:hypothetical protein